MGKHSHATRGPQAAGRFRMRSTGSISCIGRTTTRSYIWATRGRWVAFLSTSAERCDYKDCRPYFPDNVDAFELSVIRQLPDPADLTKYINDSTFSSAFNMTPKSTDNVRFLEIEAVQAPHHVAALYQFKLIYREKRLLSLPKDIQTVCK